MSRPSRATHPVADERQRTMPIPSPPDTGNNRRNPGEDLGPRRVVAMPPALHYYHSCEPCGCADDGPREGSP